MSGYNDTLELVNGALSILGIEFLVFLVVYIYQESHKMRARDWFIAMPLGIAVAFSLLVKNIGDFGRTAVVWIWRVMTDGLVPLSDFELALLCAFSVITGIGMLLMIRVFSKPFFGNVPWIACTVTVALYGAWFWIEKLI